MHAVALADANVITLDVRDPQMFLANVARTCQRLPRPKVLILNFPHNPTATVVEPAFFDEVVALAKRFGFFVIHDFAYGDIGFDGYEPPSFLAAKGAMDVGCEFTTMSKGYNMAGWRVGFAAGNREMRCGPQDDQGVLRLRAVPGGADRGDRGLAAWRGGAAAQVAEYQSRRDVLVEGLSRLGWNVEPPKAGMFVWAQIPEPWRSSWARSTSR